MISKDRRDFIRAACGGVVGVAGGALGSWRPSFAQSAAAPTVTTESLGPGLFRLTTMDTHLVASIDAEGVTLVDGGPAAAGPAVLEALATLAPGSAIARLFNTHWHPEQTGLNLHVGERGGSIIAQQNTRLWLTTDITYPWDGSYFEPLPVAAQPNEDFFDAGELASGIQYGYVAHAAHTDGDAYVYFPAADVLVVGDAVSGAGWPFVDWWTGGWIGGIVGGLELLIALSGPETRIVPARGRILNRSDLEAQFVMYNTIYERLAQLLNSGRGPAEAVEAAPTAEFDAAMGPSEFFVRQAFESLWAYLSPDA